MNPQNQNKENKGGVISQNSENEFEHILNRN